MTRYERHPAPEKLLLQITTEAVNLLALGTQDKPADVSLLETGAALTVKAWGLPQELLESSTALIQHQKELLATASGKAALPDDQLLECYDGPMTAELIWGLFETAVRLDDAQERAAIHQMALLLADALDFDEWLDRNGPVESAGK
ncbi:MULTISPECIES: hypothetical protein [Bacillota]|jgi:hypothetical protein|uniref:Uncharacterized protein n=1 Tax=Anaerotruncus colihominis TaxID=169435 RepID=A0A845SX37_9FIRM|nr:MULTISPECIES: hypothetical protein [Bacillota]MCR2026611.1 hypothetical protein [Anaerotruncus colihominis]NDO38994.1 hypothetical protein [Anaerotruncus colihominis]